MKKQNKIGIAILVIALLLTANGCGHTREPASHEETLPAISIPETASEAMPELAPTLAIDNAVIEIGYNTPLSLQGDIPIRHPMNESVDAMQGEPETASLPLQGEYSRNPVTIHLAASNVTSCSYMLEALEWTYGWEDGYGGNAASAGDADFAQSQENSLAGYSIHNGQILFERLGLYEITVMAEGADGTVLTETILVTVIDDIPPVLHVPEEISFTAGEDWTSFLAECTAEDEIDGNLYGSIVFQDERNNPFDPTIPGEYLLRFSVEDYAGNESAAISRVMVAEKQVASTVSTISDGDSQSRDRGNDAIMASAENASQPEMPAPESNVITEDAPGNMEPIVPQPQPAEAQAPAEIQTPTEALPTEDVMEAPVPETDPPTETCGYLDGSTIVTLINTARAEAGLGEVSWEGNLLELARTRANEQSIKTGHERPDGSHTIQYYGMGECTAWGYPSVQAVFDAWMASGSHQAAILWETHTKCCLAGYKDPGGIYWVLILE